MRNLSNRGLKIAIVALVLLVGLAGVIGATKSDDKLIISADMNNPDNQPSVPSEAETVAPENTTKGKPESKKSTSGSSAAKTTLPSAILDLRNWKLTLPIDTSREGNPDEIKQPELSSFILAPYFLPNASYNGVIFQAPVGGATTKNSSYPRSELREMTNSGKSLASWSNTSGTHTMSITQAITHLPAVKPDVVAGQIHDAKDDIVMIRLRQKRLFIENRDKSTIDLDTNYQLGKVFNVKITASDGRVKVYYNNELRADVQVSGSGYYFKAGCYTQSNTDKGDASSAYGQVIIYKLSVSHT